MVAYIPNILLTYVIKIRKKLQLSDSFHALVLFDHFKAQLIDCVIDNLESNNLLVVDVPANCTNHLEALDASWSLGIILIMVP